MDGENAVLRGEPFSWPTEVRRGLGLDFFMGLPASERDRVSHMSYRKPDVDLTALPAEAVPEELREQVAAWRDPNSLSNRAYTVTDPAGIDFDSPEVQAAQMPASNGIGAARAMARMYAALICEVDSTRLLTPEILTTATKEKAAGLAASWSPQAASRPATNSALATTP